MKVKIDYLETNSKIKKSEICIGASVTCKMGYQTRTNIVKDEIGDLVTDSHSILARWRNYFSQLLNIHEINDIWQTEIHTTEPLVPKPSAFEVKKAIGREKKNPQITRYRSNPSRNY